MPIHAAISVVSWPLKSISASFLASSGARARMCSWRWKDSASCADSSPRGIRPKVIWNIRFRRAVQSGVASASTRIASARADSTKTSSFKRFKACKGVFERRRLLAVRFESGASKFISCG